MDRWDPPASGGGTDVSGGSNDFLLMTGQPGLLGLSDGSISTLAPLFAAALSTGSSRVALLVGLSAAIGAAISRRSQRPSQTTGSSPVGATPGYTFGSASCAATSAAATHRRTSTPPNTFSTPVIP